MPSQLCWQPERTSSIFMQSGEKSCPKRRQTTLERSPRTAWQAKELAASRAPSPLFSLGGNVDRPSWQANPSYDMTWFLTCKGLPNMPAFELASPPAPPSTRCSDVVEKPSFGMQCYAGHACLEWKASDLSIWDKTERSFHFCLR